MDGWFNDSFFKEDPQAHFQAMHEHMNRMVDSMFRDFGGPMFGLDFDDQGHGRSRPALQGGGERSSHRPRVEEVSPSTTVKTSHRQPIVEEPDDVPRGASDRFGSSGRTNDFGSSGRTDRFGSSGRTDGFGSSGRTDRFGSSGRTDDFGASSRTDRSGKSGRGAGAAPEPYFYSASMSTYYGPGGVQQSRKKVYDSTTGKTEMAEMRRLGDQAVAIKREVDRDGHVTDTVDRKNVAEGEVDSFRRRWDEQAGSRPRLLGTNDHSHHHPRALK